MQPQKAGLVINVYAKIQVTFLELRKGRMMKIVAWLCFWLAMITAVTYILLLTGVLEVSLKANEGPPAVFYLIPVAYLVGGTVIFLKKRTLWITGAILNAVPILGFYAGYIYLGKWDVIISAPGLITKIAQILLEAGLLYLIIKSKPRLRDKGAR
jgi:hypothetical protein